MRLYSWLHFSTIFQQSLLKFWACVFCYFSAIRMQSLGILSGFFNFSAIVICNSCAKFPADEFNANQSEYFYARRQRHLENSDFSSSFASKPRIEEAWERLRDIKVYASPPPPSLSPLFLAKIWAIKTVHSYTWSLSKIWQQKYLAKIPKETNISVKRPSQGFWRSFQSTITNYFAEKL